VASVETDRGTRERLRLFDTAGLVLGAANELPRHYLSFADGYVLIYDPDVPESFETVVGIKKDIDKNRDKKEVRMRFHGCVRSLVCIRTISRIMWD
jgi:NF-kappa-B inhibitor-interacting Ras-like protein